MRAEPAVYVDRGLAWQSKQDYDKAIHDFSEAIRLDPDEAYYRNCRGEAWALSQDVDKALADFSEAIRLDPGDADVYQDRGDAWIDKNEIDKAIADYSEAVRLAPNVALSYVSRGHAWAVKKELDKAIADFDEAIRLSPEDADAHRRRGQVWGDKNEYDKAIADFDEAIRLDPKNAYARNQRGVNWRSKHEFDKALADFDEAVRLDPRFSPGHFNRGVIKFLTDLDGAVDDPRTALDLENWKGGGSVYAALLGHFAARRAKSADQAKAFLADAAVRCDKSVWPYEVVRHRRGEIDEASLLALGTDNAKMTELHCFLGLESLLAGKRDRALADFAGSRTTVMKHRSPLRLAWPSSVVSRRSDRQWKGRRQRRVADDRVRCRASNGTVHQPPSPAWRTFRHLL